MAQFLTSKTSVTYVMLAKDSSVVNTPEEPGFMRQEKLLTRRDLYADVLTAKKSLMIVKKDLNKL